MMEYIPDLIIVVIVVFMVLIIINPFPWIWSVINGWWFYFFRRDDIERMAHKRAIMCSVCPHAKHSILDIVVDDNNPDISGKHCDLCDCPLATKIRSMWEECPDIPSRWQKEKL